MSVRSIVGLLALVSACGGQDRDAKVEASRLVRDVEAIRAAPNEAKAALLPGLKGLGCTRPEICELKSACVSAYERHIRALELTAGVRTSLEAGADASHAADLTARLTEAERELEQSRVLADRCTDLEGSLRRKLKL